ncbi:MAG: M48 family metalloprotease [Gemmatimonadota bacterium]|jgi:predicted Zn-dependent protease|nr:M48 family metalloprotease [Gemmatimonadota bacterium]
MLLMGTTLKRVFRLLVLATISLSAGCAPTLQEEVALGQQTAAQLSAELPLVRDAASVEYINQLGNQIARHADTRDIQYRFYIVNASEVNAFAIPGGHVYVNRGLIERSRNVSELAGVLAHEIAHVTHRHGVEQWTRAQRANLGVNVLYGVLLGRAPSGIESAAIQVGGAGVFSGYSREAEREADEAAVGYLIASGFDPNGLVTMFETLLAERQANPSALEQWFATHPTTEERIRNAQAAIARSGASGMHLTVNTQAFNDFRARVSRLPATAGL